MTLDDLPLAPVSTRPDAAMDGYVVTLDTSGLPTGLGMAEIRCGGAEKQNTGQELPSAVLLPAHLTLHELLTSEAGTLLALNPFGAVVLDSSRILGVLEHRTIARHAASVDVPIGRPRSDLPHPEDAVLAGTVGVPVARVLCRCGRLNQITLYDPGLPPDVFGPGRRRSSARSAGAMTVFSTTLGDLVTLAGRRSIRGALLPSFVFCALSAMILVVAPGGGNRSLRSWQVAPWEYKVLVVAGFVLVVLCVAAALNSAQTALIRLAEGYWGAAANRTLGRLGRSHHQQLVRRSDDAYTHDRYPPISRPHELMPTRLGNILKAARALPPPSLRN
ncbi:hypothetical protein ACRJ4W_12150 [Streptomyces sp. GLT-R25]